MPRPKAHIFPRTTAMTATGNCGHTYSRRFDLPDDLVGAQRTPDRETRLKEVTDTLVDNASRQPCLTCQASIDHVAAQSWVNELVHIFNLGDLPQLVGSPRQVAVAEWLRYQRLVALRSLAEHHVNQLLNANVITVLLLHALNRSHGSSEDSDLSADLLELEAASNGGPFFLFDQDQETLAKASKKRLTMGIATWLLTRWAVRKVHFVDTPADAAQWVKSYFATRGRDRFAIQGPYGETLRTIPLDVVLSAIAVASQHDWGSRAEAEDAFVAGCQTVNGDLETFLASLTGTPLAETLEQSQVFTALQPPSTWEAPF